MEGILSRQRLCFNLSHACCLQSRILSYLPSLINLVLQVKDVMIVLSLRGGDMSGACQEIDEIEIALARRR